MRLLAAAIAFGLGLAAPRALPAQDGALPDFGSSAAEMVDRAKRTSVPQIFIGETHVGGFDDMVALDRAGGLKPLLEGGA